MDLTFLGTASAYPSPTRGVSCIVYRNDGVNWMFDCGEGSQIQIQKSNLRSGKLMKIFITHLHGDHVFGLPGLMCKITNNVSVDGTRSLIEVYGPVGLRRYLRTSLMLSQTILEYDYVVHELQPSIEQLTQVTDDLLGWPEEHTSDDKLHANEHAGRLISADDNGVWNVFEDDVHTVKAGWLKHRIPSFGFTIQEKPLPGRLDPKILKAKGVPPGPLYAKIKSGETISAPNGEVIHPHDVVGAPRPGRLVALLGDSSDSSQMAALCHGADVLVHEATLEDAKETDALKKGHSTPGMAGRFAHSVCARHLIITHFSQRYKSAQAEQESGTVDESSLITLLVQQAQEAFASQNVTAADDFMTVTIPQR